ncbi:MAG: zinc ABC transporter substrate-binding protein [Xenococcaceae cyanobacterium]
MRTRFSTAAIALLLGVGVIAGCSSSPTNQANEARDSTTEATSKTLDITVSIVPQEYFVEKIGGNNVKVNVMVEPGASPATYEPKPQQLQGLSDAQAYITIGVPFEKAWMKRIESANPEMPIVDSAKGIERMPMVAHHHYEEEADDHQHAQKTEAEHEHSGETLDPHIWLSPKLVKVQAQNIYEGLVKLDPDRKAEYKGNLDNFLAEIDQLDEKIRQNLAGVKNRKFMVFHPAWGYFARDYNLEQEPIELGGQEPSASELAKLVSEAKEEGIKVVFAQPEFSTKSAKTIAKEIGGEVLLISPLAPDWSDNLLQVSQTFAEVLNQSQLIRWKFVAISSFKKHSSN